MGIFNQVVQRINSDTVIFPTNSNALLAPTTITQTKASSPNVPLSKDMKKVVINTLCYL